MSVLVRSLGSFVVFYVYYVWLFLYCWLGGVPSEVENAWLYTSCRLWFTVETWSAMRSDVGLGSGAVCREQQSIRDCVEKLQGKSKARVMIVSMPLSFTVTVLAVAFRRDICSRYGHWSVATMIIGTVLEACRGSCCCSSSLSRSISSSSSCCRRCPRAGRTVNFQSLSCHKKLI